MGSIFKFLSSLFSLVGKFIDLFKFGWIYKKGISKGEELSRNAERTQAVKEARSQMDHSKKVEEIIINAAKESAKIDVVDPIAGRLRKPKTVSGIAKSNVDSSGSSSGSR